MLELKKASGAELGRLTEFYRRVVRDTPSMAACCRWIYGLHPSDEIIGEYVRLGAMYYAEREGRLLSAVALLPYQTEDYRDAAWSEPLADDEVGTLHLLAVDPDRQRAGAARETVEAALALLRRQGKKAARLDALDTNTPAQRLYETLGFVRRDVKNWYACNLGQADFWLYEKPLTLSRTTGELRKTLFSLRDEGYAAFQAKLTPGVSAERMIGVRVPQLRKLAKELYRAGNYGEFFADLPHEYYEENMLHGLTAAEIPDWETCVRETERFLPYVDNWAVCDSFSPKVFGKHRPELLEKIRLWAASDRVYPCRFGLETLMRHFLDGDFRPEYLEIPASVRSDEYYVKMMVAWFFATALAKQWDAALPWLEEERLDVWTHNKTVQKALESYRIPPERKERLRLLKRG